jgi:soluble lytic murein transglycosylase-like protein
MRCLFVALKLVASAVPIAAIAFISCQPASAYSRHSSHHYAHHAYRHAHHLHYARQQFAPWQANGFATNSFATNGGWNSASYAPAYAPAQNGFGGTAQYGSQTRSARHGAYENRGYDHSSAMASGAASSAGLPASLVQRVIARESGGNPRAVHAGNYGLMQIRLSTARAMGYTGSAAGLLDPQTNMTYGMRYLAGAYRAAGGNESRAIALYQRGYYYQAKAQGFSPYSSGAASTASSFGNYGATFQPALQTNAWPAEQYGVRHRRHYRV